MPSLKNRVTQQRDIVMGHGPAIRLRIWRLHNRLRHPVVVIPAFLAGMFFARGVPVLLRALPVLNARLRLLTRELRQFDAFVKLVAGLVPFMTNPYSVEADTHSAVSNGPRQDESG